MRKIISRWLPHHDTVKKNRWLKPFGTWLHRPYLWHFHRRAVAGGMAVGLFCGLMPGPVQMLSAALFAIMFRVNLPVSLFVTFYTNPFTIVPLYLVAYKIGAWVSGVEGSMDMSQLSFPEAGWLEWGNGLLDWLMTLGKPLLVGVPLLALGLALAGYVAVRVVWRVAVILRWRARKHSRVTGRLG